MRRCLRWALVKAAKTQEIQTDLPKLLVRWVSTRWSSSVARACSAASSRPLFSQEASCLKLRLSTSSMLPPAREAMAGLQRTHWPESAS